MISLTGIKNRFNRRAQIDLGTTVRNLTRSFTSYERSPSPETPRVARNLDRATNDAEETIAYMDDIMFAYSVANDNDDQDEKDDNPPAYYRRQARGIQQAPKKSKVRQLVRQFEEYQGTPSADVPEYDSTRSTLVRAGRNTELTFGVDDGVDDGMDEYDIPPAKPRLDRRPMRLQMRQPEQQLRPTEVRSSVSTRNSNKPTFPRRSRGMTEVENTLLVEELLNECEIELDIKLYNPLKKKFPSDALNRSRGRHSSSAPLCRYTTSVS